MKNKRYEDNAHYLKKSWRYGYPRGRLLDHVCDLCGWLSYPNYTKKCKHK